MNSKRTAVIVRREGKGLLKLAGMGGGILNRVSRGPPKDNLTMPDPGRVLVLGERERISGRNMPYKNGCFSESKRRNRAEQKRLK